MPFGMEISQGSIANPKNEYLYNRKELQESTGLYDYGARFYDPVVGRFTTLDPLAEIGRRWSPYSYVLNNPIRLIDPDGMTEGDAQDQMDKQKKEFNQESENRVADQKLINNTKTNTYTTYENGEKTGETKLSGVHYVRESKMPSAYND
jgi:RHS repeat-associated protein